MVPPALPLKLRGFDAPQREADVRLSLRADAENVALARHMMGAFGTALSLPDHLIEDLRLAVTEACTNVVRHAYPDEPGAMEIAVWPGDERLEVCVIDDGRGMAPSDDREGPGLGLPMIATLADDVSFARTVHAGSRVSMSFDRHPAGLA